jgi:small subunit ribosomal protein S3
MSQKVNPLGFRVGKSLLWDSSWVSPVNFSNFLHEDLFINLYLKKSVEKRGGFVQNCLIRRSFSKIYIILNIFYVKPFSENSKKKRFKPSVSLKKVKRITGLAKLKTNLFKLTENICAIKISNNYNRYLKLGYLRSLQAVNPPRITMLFVKYAVLFGNASLLSKYLTLQFQRNYQHNKFLGFLKQSLNLDSLPNCLGIRLEFKGRLNGSERSKTVVLSKGKVSLNTISAYISYKQMHAFTIYGVIGIKVWIYNKNLFIVNPFKNLAILKLYGFKTSSRG